MSNKTWENIKANTFVYGFKNNDIDNLIHPFFDKEKSAVINTLITTGKTEDKSLSYKNLVYKRELAIRGADLDEAKERIVEDSKTLCETLFTTKQTTLHNILFQDDLFEKTCLKLRNRNEARIVEDILPLIALLAENFAIYSTNKLIHLILIITSAGVNLSLSLAPIFNLINA